MRLTCSHYVLSNGTDLPVLEDTDLHFTIDGHKFAMFVLPAVDEFLLGSDWLIDNKCKWDFAEGTISVGDRFIRVHWRTANDICLHILVTENCVVIPQHEANIPVRMSSDGIPHPPSNWAIEPRILEPGVMAAMMLLRDVHGETVARVCNLLR